LKTANDGQKIGFVFAISQGTRSDDLPLGLTSTELALFLQTPKARFSAEGSDDFRLSISQARNWLCFCELQPPITAFRSPLSG
jgi:hypothetical protein